MKIKGAVRWRLKVVMDRCHIGTVQLAAFMKVSKGAVSKWRKAEFLPEISEKRYVQICNAINDLCDINGTPNRKIRLPDLVEFCQDEVRDLELVEYPSDDAGKKSNSNDENKTDAAKKTVAVS
jgi:hypothetical protein